MITNFIFILQITVLILAVAQAIPKYNPELGCPKLKCTTTGPTTCACTTNTEPERCFLFQNSCQFISFTCPIEEKYGRVYESAPEEKCAGLSVYNSIDDSSEL